MIHLASACLDYQVANIITKNNIGKVCGILIDPYKFLVLAFWVEPNVRNHSSDQYLVLLSQNLRRIENQLLMINDVSELSEVEGLPKLADIFNIDYQIINKRIIATTEQYLGRGSDFSFNDYNFKIDYLIVKPPFYQRLTKNRLQFSRSQIEEVSEKEIKVNVSPKRQPIKSASNNPAY